MHTTTASKTQSPTVEHNIKHKIQPKELTTYKEITNELQKKPMYYIIQDNKMYITNMKEYDEQIRKALQERNSML